MMKQTADLVDAADGAAALAKGLSLLREIIADGGSSGLGELGDRLGLSRTTVHRLLAELQRQGLVMRIRRGRYGPGLGLVSLSAGLTSHGQLAEAAREPLMRLVEQCGLTAHLGVLQNDMVTYLVKSPARKAAQIFTREHGQLEAYCSGIGKVLLAAMPPADRASYLSAGAFVALTANTLTDPQLISAALDRAKLDGFASDEAEIAEGLRCLAVPVRAPSGAVLAAISVSMMDQDPPQQDDALLALLRQTSIEIGEKLIDPGRETIDATNSRARFPDHHA